MDLQKPQKLLNNDCDRAFFFSVEIPYAGDQWFLEALKML